MKEKNNEEINKAMKLLLDNGYVVFKKDFTEKAKTKEDKEDEYGIGHFFMKTLKKQNKEEG